MTHFREQAISEPGTVWLLLASWSEPRWTWRGEQDTSDIPGEDMEIGHDLLMAEKPASKAA